MFDVRFLVKKFWVKIPHLPLTKTLPQALKKLCVLFLFLQCCFIPVNFAATILNYIVQPLNFNDTQIAFQYRSDKDLKQARLLFATMAYPSVSALGMSLTQWAIRWKLPVKGIIKNTIFKQFCGGETLQEARHTADVLGKFGVQAILDYGVEGKESEAAFEHAVPEFIKAIDAAAASPYTPFISLKVTGFARFGLLEKINSGQPLSDAETKEWQRVHDRILAICQHAADKNIMVLIDAEETWIVEGINQLADAMMARFNKERVIVFNTFQLYTWGALPFLKEAVAAAAQKGYLYGAKLVRGAYMEKERKRAQEKNYRDPIQPNKAATDRDYDAAVDFCLHQLNQLWVFIGTHNEESCRKAAALMGQLGIAPDDERVWFSQLYGMSDNISFNLANAGYHVAKYLPYGPVKDVIPYLMRRAAENTSVAGQTSRELTLINTELERRKSDS